MSVLLSVCQQADTNHTHRMLRLVITLGYLGISSDNSSEH